MGGQRWNTARPRGVAARRRRVPVLALLFARQRDRGTRLFSSVSPFSCGACFLLVPVKFGNGAL